MIGGGKGNIKINKTDLRLVSRLLQELVLKLGICLYGCKKGCYGYYVIQSSNHKKNIRRKNIIKM